MSGNPWLLWAPTGGPFASNGIARRRHLDDDGWIRVGVGVDTNRPPVGDRGVERTSGRRRNLPPGYSSGHESRPSAKSPSRGRLHGGRAWPNVGDSMTATATLGLALEFDPPAVHRDLGPPRVSQAIRDNPTRLSVARITVAVRFPPVQAGTLSKSVRSVLASVGASTAAPVSSTVRR